MALLKIIKLSTKTWKHNSDIDGNFILTKFYAKQEDNDFLLVESYGAKRRKYKINEIEVYDIGGSAETFADFDALFLRLEVLKYPAFYVDGEVTGDFIPLSGTTVGNPVTGDIEIGYSSEDVFGFLGMSTFNDRPSIMSVDKLASVHYSGFVYGDSFGNEGEIIVENGSSGILKNTKDTSLESPSNKLIYAQRKYVDNALSSSVSGTTNRIAKFTASGVVGNSKIFDNGTNVGIGNTNPRSLFHLTSLTSPGYPSIGNQLGTFFLSGDTNAYGLMAGIDSSSGTFWMQNQRNDTVATTYNILLNPVGGNIGIGATTTPGARLDIRAQGALATDIIFRVRNSSNTANLLSINGQGTLSLGLQSSAPTGIEGAIYYDSTTKKHYGFNGTTWNALY